MTFDSGGFRDGLKRWLASQQITAQQAFIAISLNMAENIIRATPVDTGWARANWWPSLNERIRPENTGVEPPNAEKHKHGKGAAGGEDRMSEVVSSFSMGKAGDTFLISNGVPYIGALEHGHSRQAPQGMVTLTMERLKGYFENYPHVSTTSSGAST